MLKRCRKHVCRSICAKSVRLVLERFSEYLVAQRYSATQTRSSVRVVEHFGRWVVRRHVSRSLFHEFLDQGVPACQCREVSRYRRRTIAIYGDTFRLLLGFLERRYHIKPDVVGVDDLDAPRVLAFLDDLERRRGNTARTRNARREEIRSFLRYSAAANP